MTEELIERFFKNECNAGEQEQVLNYFKTHPEEFGKYFNEDEWENLEIERELDESISNDLHQKVQREIFKKRGVVRTMLRIAVAACILILCGVGYFLLNKKIVSPEKVSTHEIVTAAVGPEVIERSNSTNKIISFSLEDGSVVELAPRSTIKFHQPLAVNNKRDVQLTGQASFKVASDKMRPFAVSTGGISTIVLGTYFTIKAFDADDIISIALHEGKVVVRSSDSALKRMAKDVFLTPGDEMIYNRSSALASLRHSEFSKYAATGKSKMSLNKPDWYSFNSESLAEVFNQLSSYYQTNIYYYPDEIVNRYYSGKIEKTDSLEDILNDIALLNQLKITKKNGAFFIERKSK